MHQFLLPTVSIAPPDGYTLHQVLPLGALRALIRGDEAVIEVSRVVVANGEQLEENTSELILKDGDWVDEAPATFSYCSTGNDFTNGKTIPFVETYYRSSNGAVFIEPFFSFYTVFSGADRKTFFSDNAFKFADTVQITQTEAFGCWLQGYPACQVNPAADVDESAILINPFFRDAVATVTCGLESKRVRVNAQSAIRVPFSEIVEGAWQGQFFVSGSNRLVVYLAKHSLQNPARITTVEHSDAYRGTPTTLPAAFLARRWWGNYRSRLKARIGGATR